MCRDIGAGSSERGVIGFATAPMSAGSAGLFGARAIARRGAATPLQLRAQAGEENVIEKYRQILNDVDSKPVTRKEQPNLFSKMVANAKSAIKTCETDYDCNPGGRSWPLRCVNVLFSKICIEQDDDIGGGRGISQMAMEPIPVRVEDGYYGNGVPGGDDIGRW